MLRLIEDAAIINKYILNKIRSKYPLSVIQFLKKIA